MVAPDEHPVDRAGKRVLGGFIALVVGVVAGLLVALFLVGFGDGGLVLAGGIALGTTVLGVLYPAPFLFLGSLVTSILGDAV